MEYITKMFDLSNVDPELIAKYVFIALIIIVLLKMAKNYRKKNNKKKINANVNGFEYVNRCPSSSLLENFTNDEEQKKEKNAEQNEVKASNDTENEMYSSYNSDMHNDEIVCGLKYGDNTFIDEYMKKNNENPKCINEDDLNKYIDQLRLKKI
jgi:hypothetical protein